MKNKKIICLISCLTVILSACEEVAELERVSKEDNIITISDFETESFFDSSSENTETEAEQTEDMSLSDISSSVFSESSVTAVPDISDTVFSEKSDETTVVPLNLKKKQTETAEETFVETAARKASRSKSEYRIIKWDDSFEYADYSAIHTDSVKLYHSRAKKPKNITIAVNAGHGTSGGSSHKTYCHPDKTAKYVTGSTAAGNTKSVCISSGMEFSDGTPEAEKTLEIALKMKDKLLSAGYDVLMIRETDDCQLDNIARTVFANEYAQCHISVHFDSSTSDKGAFFIGVPDIAEYRAMEPVASHYKEHIRLGEALIDGLESKKIKIYGSGRMDIDLTQTSFSTVPSVDLELGDKGTDVNDDFIERAAEAVVLGVDSFFGE